MSLYLLRKNEAELAEAVVEALNCTSDLHLHRLCHACAQLSGLPFFRGQAQASSVRASAAQALSPGRRHGAIPEASSGRCCKALSPSLSATADSSRPIRRFEAGSLHLLVCHHLHHILHAIIFEVTQALPMANRAAVALFPVPLPLPHELLAPNAVDPPAADGALGDAVTRLEDHLAEAPPGLMNY